MVSFSLYAFCVFTRIKFLALLLDTTMYVCLRSHQILENVVFIVCALHTRGRKSTQRDAFFFFFSSFVYCISSESSMFANCNEVGFWLRNKFEMRVRGAVTYTITSLQRFFNQLHADMSTNHSKQPIVSHFRQIPNTKNS